MQAILALFSLLALRAFSLPIAATEGQSIAKRPFLSVNNSEGSDYYNNAHSAGYCSSRTLVPVGFQTSKSVPPWTFSSGTELILVAVSPMDGPHISPSPNPTYWGPAKRARQ